MHLSYQRLWRHSGVLSIPLDAGKTAEKKMAGLSLMKQVLVELNCPSLSHYSLVSEVTVKLINYFNWKIRYFHDYV